MSRLVSMLSCIKFLGKSKAPPKKAAAPPSSAERELADEEVEETATELLAPDILSGLVDGNWKTRLAAAEQMLQVGYCFPGFCSCLL
jgi:hypothetical protein